MAAATRLRAFCRHLATGRVVHRPPLSPATCATALVDPIEGPNVRENVRRLLDGGGDSPLPVDLVTGAPDPSYIARIKVEMHAAAATADYRLATCLQDLLFAVEPKPMSLEQAVGGTTLEEKAAFFVKHGCIVVPRIFEGERLARLQRTWGAAQASARRQWDEAIQFGVLPQPLDGIAFANQQELNKKFPNLGGAGFGRKWFDIPVADFYREASQADGDDSLLHLIDPPPLLEVLGAICGGEAADLRCIHIQPRTVPPEDEGGYTSWHRDMGDVNSVAVSFPTDGRVVKAIICKCLALPSDHRAAIPRAARARFFSLSESLLSVSFVLIFARPARLPPQRRSEWCCERITQTPFHSARGLREAVLRWYGIHATQGFASRKDAQRHRIHATSGLGSYF